MPDELPSTLGRYFIDIVQKSFFAVCILLYAPQKIFVNIMNFVGIGEPYEISISLSLPYTFLCIHADICLHVHIFTYFFV